jgi:hypothetical protein
LSDKQLAQGIEEKDLRVFLSYAQMEARIHGGCKLRVLKYAMKELLDEGYVVQYRNADPRFRARCYRIDAQKVRGELRALPQREQQGYYAVLPRKREEAENALMPEESTLVPVDDALMHGDSTLVHGDGAFVHGDSTLIHGDDALMHTRITKNNKRITSEEKKSVRDASASDLQGDYAVASSPAHTTFFSAARSSPESHDQWSGSSSQEQDARLPESSKAQVQQTAWRSTPAPFDTTVPERSPMVAQDATTYLRTDDLSSSRSEILQAQVSRRRKATQTACAPGVSFTEEGRAIYTAWCSLHRAEIPLTPAMVKAAQALVKPVANWSQAFHVTPAELLRRMRNRLYEMDKTGYYKRGVKLHDIEREFEGWQSAMEREMRNPSFQKHIPTLAEDPYSVAALLAEQNPGHLFAS